jgi:hypothetical protein
MDEISRSNIMQRDNKKFARKLDKSLAKLAKEKNKTVSNEKGDLETFKHGSVWVYMAVIFVNWILCTHIHMGTHPVTPPTKNMIDVNRTTTRTSDTNFNQIVQFYPK